jgi:hypothetical protein
MDWYGYLCLERGTIGSGNWAALQTLFEDMGTHDSPIPAHNTNPRPPRLDGDAVIYESKFDTSEVTVEAFVQWLADTFGVPVEDIDHTSSNVSYAPGTDTLVLSFLYNAVVRFVVRRFGAGGSSWEQSRAETIGYLILNAAAWGIVLV